MSKHQDEDTQARTAMYEDLDKTIEEYADQDRRYKQWQLLRKLQREQAQNQ